jgi:hypothetical protein
VDNESNTRIRTYKTRYDKLVAGPAWNVGVDWSDVRVY